MLEKFIDQINDDTFHPLPPCKGNMIPDQIGANVVTLVNSYVRGTLDRKDIHFTWRSLAREISADRVNKQGKFIKRLDNFLYKEYNIQADPNTLATIGGRLHSPDLTITCYKLLANPMLDACHYYHAESCWWGGFSKGKDAFLNQGGFGILLYNNLEQLRGRLWAFPLNENLFLFNYYGSSYIDYIAEQIAEVIGRPGLVMQAMINGSSDEDLNPLHINGDGRVIVSESCKYGKTLILDEEIDFTVRHRCPLCNQRFAESAMHYHNGQYYCTECVIKLKQPCANCGALYFSDSLHDGVCFTCHVRLTEQRLKNIPSEIEVSTMRYEPPNESDFDGLIERLKEILLEREEQNENKPRTTTNMPRMRWDRSE